MKALKNGPQKLLITGPNLFFHSPAQATAHIPELTFHIINMSQDTFVSCADCALKAFLKKINGTYLFIIPSYGRLPLGNQTV